MTFILGVFIGFAFLFSRALTMNSVMINEFQIYYSFLNQMDQIDNNKIAENFKVMLSPKKYPLLPIALISEKNCIENVSNYYAQRFNLSICQPFYPTILGNINDFKTTEDKFHNQYIEYNDQHFIYKRLDKENIWLVAKIKDYYKSNGFLRFWNFIISGDEGRSWISSLSSFQTFFKKTKFLWSVLLPFSYSLYFFFTFYYLKQTNTIKQLTQDKEKTVAEWDALNIKLKELIDEQLILENELKEKAELNMQNQFLNQEIDTLETKNKDLLENIKKYTTQIKEIESVENLLSQKIKTSSTKLTADEQEQILEKSLQRLGQLDLLWQYKPSWKERYEIENNVSLRDEFTPFTISQAFMCFEKLVEKFVVKKDIEFKNLQLIDQINILFDQNLLPMHYKEDMHSIRKARNQWVHHGKHPSREIYNLLLDILDKTDMKPLL